MTDYNLYSNQSQIYFAYVTCINYCNDVNSDNLTLWVQNVYDRAYLVTRSTCTSSLVTRGTCFTIHSTHLPTRSTCLTSCM